MIYQSSAPRLTCIASALSHLSTGHHVAVADIMDSNNLRLLFFAPDNPCPALRRRPRLRPPQHWQSRAAVACAAECAIAADWFPESDYVGLFVVLLALLPPYRLLSTLADHDAPRFLILGNGGGVLSQLIQRLVPNALVDSVEPDAAVIQLGRLYFGGGQACISKLADARQRSCVHEMSDRSFVRMALKRREVEEEVVLKGTVLEDGDRICIEEASGGGGINETRVSESAEEGSETRVFKKSAENAETPAPPNTDGPSVPSVPSWSLAAGGAASVYFRRSPTRGATDDVSSSKTQTRGLAESLGDSPWRKLHAEREAKLGRF